MSNQSEKNLEYIREKILNDIESHVLSYHVSLGSYFGSTDLPLPIGSGTFVKFSVSSHIFYGILTAAHVIKDLKFGIAGQPSAIGLSKLINGNTVASIVPFPYIYARASIEGFQSKSKKAYRPDIAFIFLEIDKHLPNPELIANSIFYDLDAHIDLIVDDPQIISAFYRGAAPIRPDGLLDTAVCIGGGECLKFDGETQIQYWKIPNNLNESIAGASGAGFFRFDCNNRILIPSLEGVIVSEDDLTYSSIEAISSSYLYNTFLPELKNFCLNNLKYFLN